MNRSEAPGFPSIHGYRDTTGEPKQVGIWIRVSTEDQARGESPEHHEHRGRMYAEAKGWQVVEVYHLEAVSGKSVMGHPEAERMLADIDAGRITGLIFSKLARLARNTRELLEIAEIFKEHQADLVSLQESIDTSTPAGRFFYTMIAAMAQWEREEIADRIAASIPVRAKLGKPLGGKAPYGYHWVERKLVPHPEEAPVRRLIYELFREHRRVKTVVRILNEAGHRTRTGAKHGSTNLVRLLRDPSAKGLHRANYKKKLGGEDGKWWAYKPAEEWVWNPVEPIVSEELWEECNRLLDEREAGKRPAKKTAHLFAGLVVCACGRKLYVPSNTPKYVCHSCRNKIPVVDLERIFEEQLKNFLLSGGQLAQALEEGDQVLTEKRELLAALEREHDKTRAEMDKVYRLYIDDTLTSQGFGERYRPLEERARQLAEEVPRLQGEIDFLTIQYLSRDQILSEAYDLHSRWTALSSEDKRRIVESVVERITVGKEEVSLDLAYLRPPPEIVANRFRTETSTRTPWPSSSRAPARPSSTCPTPTPGPLGPSRSRTCSPKRRSTTPSWTPPSTRPTNCPTATSPRSSTR